MNTADDPVCLLCGKSARTPYPPRMFGRTFVVWKPTPGRQWVQLPPVVAEIVALLILRPHSYREIASGGRWYDLAKYKKRMTDANQILRPIGWHIVRSGDRDNPLFTLKERLLP